MAGLNFGALTRCQASKSDLHPSYLFNRIEKSPSRLDSATYPREKPQHVVASAVRHSSSFAGSGRLHVETEMSEEVTGQDMNGGQEFAGPPRPGHGWAMLRSRRRLDHEGSK